MIANDDDGAFFAAEEAAPPRKAQLTVRRLSFEDLVQSLRQGLSDFAQAPLYGLFFGGVYAVGGWLLVALVFWFDLPYLAYPLALGFALIAPFVCAGVYEVSRTLERGGAPTWAAVLGAIWARAGKEFGWLALVTLFTLILWVDFAWTFFLIFHGLHVPNLRDFVIESLTTTTGLTYLVAGNAVGALIAFFVFSITVVTPTLLVDREIDFVTAMTTSVRLVIANPLVMVAWAAAIGGLMALSIATGFLGLFIVLPVLGHAAWALYRRAIA
jgi:uncharacterized membrane protein